MIRARLAGVNSFGISGTNAHVVLEEHQQDGEIERFVDGSAGSGRAVSVSLPESIGDAAVSGDGVVERRRRFLPLSGKSEGAVRELATRYISWLDRHALGEPSVNGATNGVLSDTAWTAGVGRSHFEHRAGVVFDDGKSLRDGLLEIADGDSGTVPRTASKVAFVYTGQGSQWVGMGRSLYENEPVFRAVIDRCEEVFKEVRGQSLLDVMWGRNGSDEDPGDTAWEQPALYALGCALTALWESVGVRPSVVLGHSVGEIAAAQAAGVFSLEDGMRFAAVRGLCCRAPSRGRWRRSSRRQTRLRK